MDRWEWTRIIAAVGASIFAVVGIGWFTDLVYTVEYPTRLAYEVPDYSGPSVDLASLQRSWPEGINEPGGYTRLQAYMTNIKNAVVPLSVATATGGAAPPEPVADLGTLLASADKAKGEQVAKACMSCHSVASGGPNQIGPNLWGVVGRPVAAHAGFQYSSAMAAHGGSWTYEELDKFLARPSRAIPGTKMSFAGIRKPADRAAVLAYLGSLGSAAVPLPKPQMQ